MQHLAWLIWSQTEYGNMHHVLQPTEIRKSEASAVKAYDVVNTCSFINPFSVEDTDHQYILSSGAQVSEDIQSDVL